MTLQEKRTTMLTMVENWRASGISLARFANQENIPVSTFSYWVSRSKTLSRNNSQQAAVSSDFIQLTGNRFLPDEINQEIRLQYPNGVSLIMPSNTPVKNLKKLIEF